MGNRAFLVILCLSLCGNLEVNASYLNLLKPRGSVNGTVFDVTFSVTSGILDSGYESNFKENYRLNVVPYGKDKVYVSLKQVNATVRNGDIDTVSTLPKDYTLKLSDEKIKDFIITHEGKIILRKTEQQKNVNFYKTIANFLVFHYEPFKVHVNIPRSTYLLHQPTIYGRCTIRCVGAIPSDGGHVEVKQFFDPRTCDDFVSKIFSDNEDLTTLAGLDINNYRKYYIVERNSDYVLDAIEAVQRVFWEPSDGKSLTHFIRTAYNFTFVEEAALSLDDTDFDFENEKSLSLTVAATDYFEEEKSFAQLESVEDTNIGDFINEVRSELKEVVHIWETHLINSARNTKGTRKPAIELVKTMALMEFFKFKDYTSLWESLKTDSLTDGLNVLSTFYDALPNVGTEGSVLFIRKLIVDKDISAELGDKMLTKLAGSIRQPSLKALQALKDIAESNTYPSVLAFTSAVGVANRNNPTSGKLKELTAEVKKDIFAKIKASSNDMDQRIYIQALGNLHVPLDEPEALELNELWTDDYSEKKQEKLMWLVLSLEKSTSPDYLFEVAIQILRNVQYNSEFKAVALRIALNSLPSPDSFIVVARIMDAETNYELFNLFESSVRARVKAGSLPKTTLPWLRHREPMSRSEAFIYESSADFPMRVSIDGYILFDDKTWALKQIHINFYHNYHGKLLKLYSVFLRLSGMKKFFSFKDISYILNYPDKIKFDMTFYRGERVVSATVDTFDYAEIINHCMRMMQEFALLPFKTQRGDISQHCNADYFFPIDAGKNAHIQFNLPWMASAKFHSLKVQDRSTVMNFIASLNYTAQSVTGMHVYQPKIQAFQGTREYSSFHFTEQIALKVYVDKSSDKFNFFVELIDALTPLYGIRFKKDTQIVLNRIGGAPVASNENGNMIDMEYIEAQNTSPMQKNEDLLLWHLDIGAKYQITMSDYSAPPNNWEFPKTISQIFYKKPFATFFQTSDGEFFVNYLSYIYWNFLALSAYSYNFKATLEPCHVFPIRKYAVKVMNDHLLIEFRDKDDKVRVYYKFSETMRYNQILRMGPGIESSGICFSELIDTRDRSSFQFFYGTSAGDLIECPKDQFSLVVDTKSEFSEEQILHHNNQRLSYRECIHKSPNLQLKDPTNSQRCAKAATMLRDMTVNVNFKNPPKDILKTLNQFWLWFLSNNHGIPSPNVPSVVGWGDITLKANFPIKSPHMNLDVLFLGEKYSFEILHNGFTPDNIAITPLSLVTEFFLPSPYCVVVTSANKQQSTRHLLQTDFEWTKYAEISQVNVFVKKTPSNLLAVKVLYLDYEIVIQPRANTTSSDKYEITLGENQLDVLPMDWFSRRFHTIRVLDTLFIMPDAEVKDQNFIVGYSGQRVMIMGSNGLSMNHGICFGAQDEKVWRDEL